MAERMIKRAVPVLGSVFVVVGVLIQLSSSALSLSGSDFKRDRIMDDALFYKGNALTAAQIQTFLNAKMPVCDTNGEKMYTSTQTRAQWASANGKPLPPYVCLKDFRQDHTAKSDSGLCSSIPAKTNRTAAQIIDDVARACSISQKALIVLLQKEQSLITDDWPWPVQYEKATGYYCPDDPDNPGWCHPDYAGFFNQVYNAAKQFNRYKLFPDTFNHAVDRTSFVAYQANSDSCGGTNITMLTAATAGLYNYTPYQPNAAALANLYGLGDSCSAYGNRNFWRLFNDWFGTTLVSVIWMQPENSNTQYVVYDGKKQAIASPDARRAWNIESLPLEIWTADRANNTATHNFGNLTRKARRVGTSNYYYIDDHKRYLANNSKVRLQWNIPDIPSYVTPSLLVLTQYSGNLSTYVTDDTASVYFVDNETLRPITSPTTLHAWRKSEPVATMSSSLLQTIMTTGTTLEHNRISNNGNEYLVSGGARFKIPADLTSLYPHTATAVSNNTIAYLTNAGNIGRFVRSTSGGGIFIVDGLERHGLPNLDVYNSYKASGDAYSHTSSLKPQALSLIDQGSHWRSTLVSNSTNYYLIRDGVKHLIPTNLVSSYNASANTHPVSNNLLSIYAAGANVSPYVTSKENRAVFLLDVGNRLGISNPTTLQQLLKQGESTTLLTNHDLLNFPYIKNIANYFSNGGQNYFIDSGTRYLTSVETAADWGLTADHLTAVSADTLGHYVSSPDPLTNYATVSGKNYLVSNKKRYETNSTTENLWGITSADRRTLSSNSLFRVKLGGKLDRFAAKDGAIYTTDAGALIGISNLSSLFNFGYKGQTIVTVSGSVLANMTTSPIVIREPAIKDTLNTCYIMDGGIKRIPSNESRDDWCFDIAGAITLSDTYLNLLSSGSQLTRSIRASGDNTIYAVDDGTKRWIPTNSLYETYFSPFSTVSRYLRDTLPTGATIGPDGN